MRPRHRRRHRRSRLALALTALLVLQGFAGAGAGAGRAAERQACPAFPGFPNPAAVESTRRGFNLPGWDRPDPSPGRPDAGVLKSLRRLGMTHIRLPVDDAKLYVDAGTARTRDAYLRDLVGEIDELRGLGFTVTVDLHPGPRLSRLYTSDPDAALRALESLWTDLAGAVRLFEPEGVYAELLNEPATTPGIWAAHARALAVHVRRLLPRHTLIVGPAGPQRHEALAGMVPLADPNVLYAVHYYDPFAFTHQGADWEGPDSALPFLRNLPFPASAGDADVAAILGGLDGTVGRRAADVLRASLDDGWNEAAIGAAFAQMASWSRRYGRPVIVDEFGVYAAHAPRAARLAWLKAVAAASEARCIGWTHWDYGDGFGLLDPRTRRPDEGVIGALMPAGNAPGGPRAQADAGAGRWSPRP